MIDRPGKDSGQRLHAQVEHSNQVGAAADPAFIDFAVVVHIFYCL